MPGPVPGPSPAEPPEDDKAIILGLEMTTSSTITISVAFVLVFLMGIIGLIICFQPASSVRRKRVQFDLYM